MEQMTMEQTGVSNRAKITVLGIGGGGGNAINNMINAGLEGVHFIAANTDWQVLERNLAPTKIQLGTNLTKGLGAGGQPEMGAKATQEDIDKIRQARHRKRHGFHNSRVGRRHRDRRRSRS